MPVWEAHERRVAKALGARCNDNQGESTPDVTADWPILECKSRKRASTFLRETVEQVRKHAGEG